MTTRLQPYDGTACLRIGLITLLLMFGASGSQAQKAAPSPPNDVWSLAISKDGKYLAGGSGWWDQPGEIGIWDIATREPLRRYTESLGVASLAFSADGKLLASGSWNGHVRVRDWASAKVVADYAMPGVARVAFAPQGQLLATATESKSVQLWDPAEAQPLADLQGDLFRFHCVTFSPDGQRVAAGGGNWVPGGIAQVTIWDVASRKQVLKLIGHTNAILCLAYSPMGDRIATGATDRTLRLWDADSGELLKTFAGHGGYVEGVAFTPDGKTVISGCRDGKIRYWDIAQGKEVANFKAMTSVAPVRVTPDGLHLFVGGTAKTLKLYDATSQQELAVLWSGAGQKSAMNDLSEAVYQIPRTGGSLAGTLFAGFAAVLCLFVLLYACQRRTSATDGTSQGGFAVEIIAIIGLVLAVATALMLLWVRSTRSQAAGELTPVQKIAEKVRALESDTIESKSLPNFGDDDVTAMGDLPNLRHLKIDHSAISDKALSGIDRFPNLVELSIGHSRVSDAGLAELGGLTRLRELRLDKLPISDAGLKHLAGLTNLESLYLDETNITDEGLANLKDMIKLQKLSLWRTHVTDAGTQLLRPLRSLKHLSLDETGVTDAGLDALTDLPELTNLSVWKTKVSADGAKGLKQRAPKLKINR